MVTQEVNRILKRYNNDATDIIAVLQEIQQTYRYLPQDVLEYLSRKMDVPLSRIYHLATFFRAFSLEPRGKHQIYVCMGTACHVRGAPRILEAMERKLKIPAGGTTPDQNYTLETVNCVGACALGPLAVMDDKSMGKMTIQKVDRMLGTVEAAPKGKKKAPAKKVAAAKGKPKKAAPPKKASAKAPPKKKADKPSPAKKPTSRSKAGNAGAKKAGKPVTKKARG